MVVDPRRTETAELADTYIAVRPGTDILVLLGMLQVLFAEELIAPGRLRDQLLHEDKLRELCRDFDPERTASMTGVSAERLRALTRDFAKAPRAVCYGRMGVSTQSFGALCQWLIQLLNILTGNLDREGGAMFAEPAFDVLGLGSGFGQRGSYGKRHTRVRGLPEFGGEFPVAALAEEILTPGTGQIRALVTAAGNPVLSTPNGRQLDDALSKLDFMVSVDIYLNETTRHAHLILPPTFGLERDHFDLVFHGLAIRNTVKYALPAVAASPLARHDSDIFEGLAQRIEAEDPTRRPALGARLLMSMLTPKRLVALGIRRGRRGAGWWPFGTWTSESGRGLTLRQVIRAPHGMDLGPLEPCLPERLRTPHRRIDLVPDLLAADLVRVRETFFVPGAAPSGLLLIGRRDLRSNNSWGHNSYRLVKGPRRCTLRMHPDDARDRDLQTGDRVQVTSRVGTIEVTLELVDDVMPGVVSLPHGWGHDRPGIRLPVAGAYAGVSANDLTDEQFIDQLSGNAALNGLAVTVTRVAAAA